MAGLIFRELLNAGFYIHGLFKWFQLGSEGLLKNSWNGQEFSYTVTSKQMDLVTLSVKFNFVKIGLYCVDDLSRDVTLSASCQPFMFYL